MLDDYVSKDATWRRAASVNQYGETSYTDETIRVKWQGRNTLVRDAQGNNATSNDVLYTDSPVAMGDAIIDQRGTTWSVITVNEYEDLDGDIYFEVAL